jgi:hypothetical protein
MLFGRGKDKAATAQRAAALGGAVGWPTPDWMKGRRLISFSPFSQIGSRSFPISGTVAGRVYTSYRVSSSFTRRSGSTTHRTTYSHTAAVITDSGVGLPAFELVSRLGSWEKVQTFDQLRVATGDAQFDQFFTTIANAPDRRIALSVLTPPVKQALYNVLRANSGARIRLGGPGLLFCWIDGKDARDQEFPALLTALAALAGVVDSAPVPR